MAFVSPGAFYTDSDGFAGPTYGGDVAVKYGSFTFEDVDPKTLFTLPEGAVIVDFMVTITEAFNDGTTETADVGFTGAGAALVNDLALGTVGVHRAGATSTVAPALFDDPLEAATDVIAEVTLGTGDADAGAATVAVWYILR
jgi:hypothetical protein